MILEQGDSEGLKAGLHAAAGALVGVFCLYNLAAFLTREECEWHLARNALLYGALTIYEGCKVRTHCARS